MSLIAVTSSPPCWAGNSRKALMAAACSWRFFATTCRQSLGDPSCPLSMAGVILEFSMPNKLLVRSKLAVKQAKRLLTEWACLRASGFGHERAIALSVYPSTPTNRQSVADKQSDSPRFKATRTRGVALASSVHLQASQTIKTDHLLARVGDETSKATFCEPNSLNAKCHLEVISSGN